MESFGLWWGYVPVREREFRELVEKAEKLEAVKTWLIKAKAEGRVSMNVGFSLGLVLGVEDDE